MHHDKWIMIHPSHIDLSKSKKKLYIVILSITHPFNFNTTYFCEVHIFEESITVGSNGTKPQLPKACRTSFCVIAFSWAFPNNVGKVLKLSSSIWAISLSFDFKRGKILASNGSSRCLVWRENPSNSICKLKIYKDNTFIT